MILCFYDDLLWRFSITFHYQEHKVSTKRNLSSTYFFNPIQHLFIRPFLIMGSYLNLLTHWSNPKLLSFLRKTQVLFIYMLTGLKVIEFEGLAPSVFCGMYFADQGADVILVARPQPVPFSMEIDKNIMNRHKRCIKLSLKSSEDRIILIQIIKNTDIIIDPYRPEVLQKQNLGPQDLYKINPNVILLRVSGYGQTGNMALKPGHDLNYIASSGILKLINLSKENPQFPANYLADFVSASLGIKDTLKALMNRKISGQGSVVDCSLAGGCSYLRSLVDEKETVVSHQRKQAAKYFTCNGKRYVLTYYDQRHKIQEKQVHLMIQEMYRKNETFFNNEFYEIAQISKIPSIKDALLKSPFGYLRDEDIKTQIIPTRDQNREQILKGFKILSPKL